VEPPLTELRPLIDWTFFFTAWELKGRYPQILDHPQQGEAARELFENGNELLDAIIADGSIQARGVYGFWPAQAEGDDIVLADGSVFPMLRQQVDHGADDDRPNRSLADYIAPPESGLADHLGGFAVTAGLGADELAKTFEADLDDYRAIMVKALADRLAEAFAEWLPPLGPTLLVRARRRPAGHGAHPGAVTGASGRRSATRPARITREAHVVRPAGRTRPRHGPHDELRDDTRRDGGGRLLRPPAGSLLQRGSAGQGSGRGLRAAQGSERRPRPNGGYARTCVTNRIERARRGMPNS
jgi:hypothetical protein